VIDVGQSIGFVVDRVASVMSVETNRIESVDTISSTVDTELLSGLVKDMGDHKMVMILDFAKLIEREFTHINVSVKTASGVENAAKRSESISATETASDERQLVSFVVAEQEYAIAISDVQEIVHIPDTIIHVPHAQDHVLGIMTLRSRLLPLMNLRKMFALAEQKVDERSRIVVLSLGTSQVGIVVDSVREVLRVAESDIGAMPPILAREGEFAEICGICRLEAGKRLVSIIAAQNLFDHSSVKEALSTVNTMENEMEQDDTQEESVIDDVEQEVVFKLDKEEFGVPIETVQEIVRIPDELTRVPHSQVFVEGVINLRGMVLPVVDLRTRLGMARVERSDRQRIMVFLLAGMRTGFIVDQVSEVLRIPKNVIEPSPRLSGEQGTLLSRMANLEKVKRMIQLIDPAHLLDSDTTAELHKVTAAVKK
jgi:purine-binding chemotaxis protein CheW